MNIYTNSNSAFPSQVVPAEEKSSWEYGSQVAQAIETEWFNQGRTNGNRFLTSWNKSIPTTIEARDLVISKLKPLDRFVNRKTREINSFGRSTNCSTSSSSFCENRS